MNGESLAPGLVLAALGLALSDATSTRVFGAGVAALLASVIATALVPADPGLAEPALAACWLSVLVAAACVYLPDPLRLTGAVALCVSGGVWAGLVLASDGETSELSMALPWALTCLPGRWLAARGKGVVSKVVLSWLGAIAVLSLGLSMTPTLGYEPAHRG